MTTMDPDPGFEVVPDKCDKVDSIWHYFWRKKTGGEAKCQFADCGHKVLKTSDGSTKGCRSHLKVVHGVDLAVLAKNDRTSGERGQDEEAEDEFSEEAFIPSKMSLRSSNRFDKTRYDENVSDSGSTKDVNLQDKVCQLEHTLKKFRAEVDMKMSIMQQILSTRNEMFTVQKKLIEREQALHESVLSHWKNIPDLAATGLSLRFTDDGDNDVVDVIVADDQANEKSRPGTGQGTFAKRKASSASARRDRQKKVKTRHREGAGSDSESASDAGPHEDPIPFDTFGDEDDTGTGGAEADGENNDEEGNEDSTLERKVFVNYYSEEPAKPGQLVTRTPIWKYYLREENGESALCKLCDEGGVQTILKVKKGHGTSVLHKHLKFKHADFAVDLVPLKKESEAGGSAAETSTDGRCQQPGSSSSKRTLSKIWNYFKRTADQAKCNACSIEVKCKFGNGIATSSLRNHLKFKHKEIYAQLLKSENQR